MTLSEQIITARREVITEILREPKTISQLKLTLLDEHSMEFTDSTLRRTVRELNSIGIIQPTGLVIGKEPVYQTGTKFTMPRIFNPLNSKSYNPVDIQHSFAEGDWQLLTLQHTTVLEKSLNTLLNSARKMSDGSATDVQEEIDRVKANCTKSLSSLLTYTKMIEQLLSQRVWWSSKSIASVTQDASFNAQQVWDDHGKGLDR